uniref:Putative secreted protein n=1 Tax=Ixodes ricinus TaxID=34613 RepID=A0A6B0UDZ1_IXORI
MSALHVSFSLSLLQLTFLRLSSSSYEALRSDGRRSFALMSISRNFTMQNIFSIFYKARKPISSFGTKVISKVMSNFVKITP